jgi:leucyl-tRNA synthetase
MWQRLGHTGSLAYEPFPVADAALLVDDTVEVPVQINGKVRTKVTVAADIDKDGLESAARSDAKIGELLQGKQIVKTVVVPGRMVNFVVKEQS